MTTRSVPLSDLIRPSGRRANKDIDLTVFSVTKHRGFVPSLDYFTKQVFGRELGSYKVVESGEFAYATIHLDEGSIGRAPQTGLVSPMYTVFALDEGQVDPEYLLRFLKCPMAMREYSLLGKGTAERRKSISLASLGKLTVPLPSLPQQRRIAEILSRADESRTKRRRTLELQIELVDAIFNEMFCDINESWPIVRLGTLVDEGDHICYGVVQPGDAMSCGIPLVRVGDLSNGRVSRSDLKLISAEIESSYTRSRLRGTEILVSCVGSIGKIAVAEKVDAGSNIARAVARVPVSEKAERTYVAAALRSPSTQAYFESELRTVSQPTLNIKQLSATLLALPPRSLQAKFRERAESANALHWRAQAHLAMLDEFFASLQHRAFNGEL